jgi:MFS transporter, SP family, arabinose:H+ symporter
MKTKNTYNLIYVWSISLTAAMGGMLFGYDWVVIGGAKPFYEEFFHLTTPAQIGWAMSSALVGCLIGAVISGMVSDRFGRKKMLILTAAVFIISAIGTGLSNTFILFIFYRMIGGAAIGLASSLSPMYIAEVAPSEKRGMFVSINQLTIVIGVLAAQFVNWQIADPVPDDATSAAILNSWNGQFAWRWMFAAEAVPAFLFFVFMFFVPESPRWLVKNGKDKAAHAVFSKIGGFTYANETLIEIKKTLKGEIKKINFKVLLEPKLKKIILLGIFLAVFQQWCGINTVFYYADEIFTAAGYTVSDILFNIVITGTIMLIFTFIAIKTVDRLGRKILMLIGAFGLGCSYILISGSYFFDFKGLLVVILVVIAVAIYSFTLAPITWVLISEIFPNRIRGAAMSIAVFSLWTGCFTLTYSFPFLNQNLGTAFTYLLYALICFIGFVVLKIKLPETKGKSLEELERELLT